MPKIELPENELHLWLVAPPQIREPGLIQQYHTFLNPEEATQQARFHFEKHRHSYLVTRAMIRTLLSSYTGFSPEELEFHKNEYGRPELVQRHRPTPIHFNISHTDGLIVCGMVLNRELGVDVEDITRGGDLINIADRFFSPSEVKDLGTVPDADKEYRFFDYWTLKEAYIKARGMGLSIPLEQFSYHLSDEHTDISLTVDPRQNDRGDRWQFKQFFYDPHFKIGVCLEKNGQPTTVKIHKYVPCFSTRELELREFRSSQDW